MKKNKINLFFVFCAIIFCATCFLIPITNNANNVSADSLQVVRKTGSTSTSASTFSVLYANKDTNITFKINNFTFEVGDIITYYFLNDNTSSKYQNLIINDQTSITITNININTASEIILKPSILGEPATYKIMATVQDASTGYLLIASPITFELCKPEDITLSISYEILNSQSGEINTYRLIATLKYNGYVIDPTAYEIRWYLANMENNVPFANRTNFEWTPPELGTYTIRAEVDGTSSVINSGNVLSLLVVYGNTFTLIVAVSAIALLMTAGVIISTVIKVKKERVW
ncbi:MAG: hypothetical protein PHQ62_03320 [Clostridia bacterium]|nr:hypothetical protein [Clostridia bacterium]